MACTWTLHLLQEVELQTVNEKLHKVRENWKEHVGKMEDVKLQCKLLIQTDGWDDTLISNAFSFEAGKGCGLNSK